MALPVSSASTPRPSLEEMTKMTSDWAGSDASKQEAASRILHVFRNNWPVLTLDKLNLDSLPSCIGHLTTLTHINLSDNLLTDLSGLQDLTNLKHLDLSHNRLTRLSGFGAHPHLLTFDASHNFLEALPDTSFLGNTTEYVCLYLENNKLQSLPSWLTRLPAGSRLEVVNNSFHPTYIATLAARVSLLGSEIIHSGHSPEALAEVRMRIGLLATGCANTTNGPLRRFTAHPLFEPRVLNLVLEHL